jgi:Ni/Co efflux regulator RcnB
MRRSLVFGLLACTLAAPALAQGTDRSSGMQQTLQGLLSGNRDQDRALQDAYERGYQRGREDEARVAQRGRDDRGGYSSGRSAAPDYRGSGSGSYSR